MPGSTVLSGISRRSAGLEAWGGVGGLAAGCPVKLYVFNTRYLHVYSDRIDCTYYTEDTYISLKLIEVSSHSPMKVERWTTLVRRTNGALSPSVLVANPRNAETSQRNQTNEPIPIGLGMTPPFD